MRIDFRGTKIPIIEDGRGQPVIFLHGWKSEAKKWNPPVFFKQKFKVVAPSLPTYYETSDRELRTLGIKDYQELVIEIINKLKLDNPVLVGHSTGSQIALYTYLTNPNLVKAAALVSYGSLKSYAGAKEPSMFSKKLGDFISTISPAPQRTKIAIRKRHYRRALRPEADITISDAAEIDTFLNLVSIPVPKPKKGQGENTVILWGDKDTVTPIEAAHELASRMRCDKLRKFEGSGHFPFVDTRKPFYEALQEAIEILQKPEQTIITA